MVVILVTIILHTNNFSNKTLFIIIMVVILETSNPHSKTITPHGSNFSNSQSIILLMEKFSCLNIFMCKNC